MIKKYPPPKGGAGVVVDIKDFRKQNSTTPPVFSVHGWHRVCIRCRVSFPFPYVRSTIRDGRERVCTDCFLQDFKRWQS